jgi:hypothetical protein
MAALGLALLGTANALTARAASPDSPAAEKLRVGFVGLDTSHAGAFAKLIREAPASSAASKLQIVAAWPGGSPDIPSSADRVAGYTQEFERLGIEIVGSLDELLPKVDAVILTSLDGRAHLPQVVPILRAGKPVFIDKPLAADLADAVAIDRAAKAVGGRWFTSSSLRFTPTIWRYRTNTDRPVLGVHAWSPCSLEPHHTDLAWYGIHGVEALFTAMGTGCESVSRTRSDGADVSVGRWSDGRIGLFRGIRDGSQGYGLTVFGKDFIESDAKYEGYGPLVEQIALFLLGGPAPVAPAESLEIMAFIQAAQASSDRGGAPVKTSDMMAAAQLDATARLAPYQLPTPSEKR